MVHWEKEKKWLMIHQDHQAELLASGVPQNQLEHAANKRTSMEVDRLPNSASPRQSPGGPLLEKSASTPIHPLNHSISTVHKPHHIIRKSRSIANLSTNKKIVEHEEHNSPEFFVRKFLDPNLRSVTPKIAASLEVSLRTRSIDWVVNFIRLKGFHVLSHALGYLNHSAHRRDTALELEVEIVKCIKAIVNTKVGGKEAMDHPEYIHTVVFSIHCPQWQTRKMVCELLAFLCYLDGYEHVVQGFEQLRKFKMSLALYDTWMREFLRTIDHGKGKSEKLPESNLMDYAVT